MLHCEWKPTRHPERSSPADGRHDHHRRVERRPPGRRTRRAPHDGQAGSGPLVATTSPSAARILPMSPTSRSSSSAASPTVPNRSAFSVSTARSNRRRPLAVISTSVARASVGWDARRHRPAASRRSIAAGDGARGDPQAVADRAERQRTGPSQHPEHLVASEGQPERAQGVGGPAEEDLLGPHHRDDRGHARRACRSSPARSSARATPRRGRTRAGGARGEPTCRARVGDAADHAVRPGARSSRRRRRRGRAAPRRCARRAAGPGGGGTGRVLGRTGSAACCAGPSR